MPTLKCAGLQVKHKHSGFSIDCQAVYLPPVTFSTGSQPSIRYAAVDQALENQAVADLNSSINDQRAISVNWAMTYAERRDTITMLNKRTAQLIGVLRNLRRGRYEKSFEQLFGKKPSRRQRKRWQKKARTKDRAASLWLEWTYGWSPLLSDVYGAIDDLVKTPRPLILRCTGKAVPRTLPISLLQPDAVFIIVYTTKTHDLHAIVAHNHRFYDPQHQCDVPASDLLGHIVAIYHCQRALSLADIHNELASLS